MASVKDIHGVISTFPDWSGRSNVDGEALSMVLTKTSTKTGISSYEFANCSFDFESQIYMLGVPKQLNDLNNNM